MTFHHVGYDASRSEPNIVVDGSANESTVLTLSHWPGAPTPPALARDLSAEIAFAYLDDPPEHPPASAVTNNHFDQDGIVSVFALVDPASALTHRDLLIDVAAAGDFATYRDRRAARASMTLARLASQRSDDCTYDDHTDRLYAELLPRLMDIVLDGDRYRELWADEDAALTASEAAIADGHVRFDERPDLDLAIVTLDPDQPIRSGHRFGHAEFVGLHPMAIHNATDRFRLLVMHGRTYRFVDRYETWVEYRSRATLPRVDMRPLADELTALESGSAVWEGGGPDALSPELRHTGESSIEPDALLARLVAHLSTQRSAPGA